MIYQGIFLWHPMGDFQKTSQQYRLSYLEFLSRRGNEENNH